MTTTTIETDTNPKCACSCGLPVRHPSSTFLQGHDQRLISVLAQDVVEGTGRGLNLLSAEDANLDIQIRIDRVSAEMSERLSPGLAAKFRSAAMRRWEKAGKGKPTLEGADGPRQPVDPFAGMTEEDEDRVTAPELATEGHGLGAKVRVKVGRYTYDGEVTGMNQSGKVIAVTYTNKAGNAKTIAAPKEIKIV